MMIHMLEQLVPGDAKDSSNTAGIATSIAVADHVVNISKRKPGETEDSVSGIVGDKYLDQVSYILETDDSGNEVIKEVAHGTKGSIRPDHVSFDKDSNTWYVLEDKNYSIEKAGGREGLIRNICEQAESRIKVLGAEGATVKQTYVIDLQGHLFDNTGKPVSVVEANKIVTKIHKRLIERGINPRFVRIKTLFGDNINTDITIKW